jgi:peptidoglycan/LPS O-acetylase OafA/YrhL
LVSLGRFSYSLYLVHAPVLALVALACREAAQSVVVGYAVIVGAGIPLAILVAYLFFLVFERPFLTARPRRARQGQARAEPPTVSRSAP